MDTQIQKFIDILTDNNLIIKRYEPEYLSIDDPRFENFEFNENLLISEDELSGDELMEFIEFKLYPLNISISFILHGCTQPAVLEDFLEHEFEEFRNFIANNFNRIEKEILKEIVKKAKASRNELMLLLNADSRNKIGLLDSLLSVKIDFCNETIRYLNNPLNLTDNRIEKKQVKLKKPIDNLTSLTQNQVVILFHYLRKQELVGRGMPDNMYAHYISQLTGFANEPIRKDLSNIKNIDSGEFIEANFSTVRRVLNLVTNRIKSESEERFS